MYVVKCSTKDHYSCTAVMDRNGTLPAMTTGGGEVDNFDDAAPVVVGHVP